MSELTERLAAIREFADRPFTTGIDDADQHVCDQSADIQALLATVEAVLATVEGYPVPSRLEDPTGDITAALESMRAAVERAVAEQLQEARDERDAPQTGAWWLKECPVPTVPRVITADELREGQTVAVYSDRRGVAAGVVYDLEPDVFRLDPGFHHSRTRYRPWMLSAIRGETTVLLQAAPQPTGYADDDHQDAEVTDWHKPHRVVFQRASEAQ